MLRDALKGILNEDVRWDPHKKGFNASITSLVDVQDKATRARLVEDNGLFDVVNRNRVQEMLNEDLSQNSFSKFLFSFISAKLFMETYG